MRQLVRLVENRPLPVPRLPFLLARLNFLDVLLVQRDRIGNAGKMRGDEAVFPNSGDFAANDDCVADLNFSHEEYLARAAQEARV